LPLKRVWQEGSDQIFIVGAKAIKGRPLWALRVQIVRVELTHHREQTAIVRIHQEFVFPLAVRGVETVPAHDRECLLREVGAKDMVEILVMPPGEVNIVEAAAL